MCGQECNALTVRCLHKSAENCVFAPNHCVVENKCVVFNVVCCDFWVVARRVFGCGRWHETNGDGEANPWPIVTAENQ